MKSSNQIDPDTIQGIPVSGKTKLMGEIFETCLNRF